MSLTYGYTRKHALKLLDEYTTAGAIDTTEDVLLKIRDATNDAMYDLAASTSKIHGEYYIEQSPVYNELSRDTSNIKTHTPEDDDEDDFSIELEGAKSCFFEATGPATVVLEESDDDGDTWSEIESISIASSVTDFTEYRRLISPAVADNIVRLRFDGAYIYHYRNYILYPYTWSTAADVQQHRPQFIYSLPSDFMMLDSLMIKKSARQYVPYTNYILRSDMKISVSRWDSPAEFLLHYWRYPTLFTFTDVEVTDDAQVYGIVASTTYRVSDNAALIIPYFAAGQVMLSEGNPVSGITLMNIYESKKAALTTNLIAPQGVMINATGW